MTRARSSSRQATTASCGSGARRHARRRAAGARRSILASAFSPRWTARDRGADGARAGVGPRAPATAATLQRSPTEAPIAGAADRARSTPTGVLEAAQRRRRHGCVWDTRNGEESAPLRGHAAASTRPLEPRWPARRDRERRRHRARLERRASASRRRAAARTSIRSSVAPRCSATAASSPATKRRRAPLGDPGELPSGEDRQRRRRAARRGSSGTQRRSSRSRCRRTASSSRPRASIGSRRCGSARPASRSRRSSSRCR